MSEETPDPADVRRALESTDPGLSVAFVTCPCGWKASGDTRTVADLLAAHAQAGCAP